MRLAGAFAQSRNPTTSILVLGFCPETEPREGRGKDFDAILKLDCNSYFRGSLTSGLSFTGAMASGQVAGVPEALLARRGERKG